MYEQTGPKRKTSKHDGGNEQNLLTRMENKEIKFLYNILSQIL